MKEVNLYIFGKCQNLLDNKPGAYIVKMEYKHHIRQLNDYMEDMTTNRALIIGLIEAVKLLKEPCIINVHIQTYIGFKKIISKHGGYKKTSDKKNNGSLLNQLSEVLETGGHKINEILTNRYSNALKKELDQIYQDKWLKVEV